jgi:hypothetical protein
MWWVQFWHPAAVLQGPDPKDVKPGLGLRRLIPNTLLILVTEGLMILAEE